MQLLKPLQLTSKHMSIGSILKEKRKEKGLMLNDVAEHLGIDVSIISRFENGIRIPNAGHISKICKLYGIQEDEIQIMHLTDEIITLYGDNKYLEEALKRATSIIKQKKL